MTAPLVLFALTEHVRQNFLPGFEKGSLPPMNDFWVDPSDMKEEDWKRLLADKGPEVIVSGWGSPTLPEPGTWTPKPGYLCHLAGSVKGQVSRSWIEQGLLVSNWGSAISHTIAEHALLLVLGTLRNMPLWSARMSPDSPNTEPAMSAMRTRSLRGKRVGLHGFGAIARELVAFLKPFGVTLSAYSAGVPEQLFRDHQVRCCADLQELFSGSQILIEVEALTEQTRGVVNRDILRLLPEEAVFVNVGRGAVVDETALADLAAEKKIRIGLDVYREEPLPGDSPLRNIPGVLLSPHIAGPTADAFPHCGQWAMRNLAAYLEGKREKIQGIVTSEIFDRTT